jgi:hypothetical protein
MLVQALAHVTGVPHAHTGDTVAAVGGVLLIAAVVLAPRMLRWIGWLPSR